MILEIGVVYDLMDESGGVFYARFVCGRVGAVKGKMKPEVGKLFFEL